MSNLWLGIKPGDVGFSRGEGIVGWIIRHGTTSPYAHSFIYHRLLGTSPDGTQTWETVESYGGDGVRTRVRTQAPEKVVRVWRNSKEQARILEKSSSLVGSGYGWGEIVRIAFRLIGIKLPPMKDNPKRLICSNHTLQSVLAARPSLEYFFKYAPHEIWPGEVAKTLDSIVWVESRIKERKKRFR